MKRKTFNVEQVKTYANQLLRDEAISPEVKDGIDMMINFILHKSDNYNGFMFNKPDGNQISEPNYFDRKYF
jgi:hypothetical protein